MPTDRATGSRWRPSTIPTRRTSPTSRRRNSVPGRPTRPRPSSSSRRQGAADRRMKFLRVEPLQQPLSRLALGTLGFSTATRDREYAVLDAWVEAGGTVIDTAHVYEDGDAERVVGQWLRDRPGVRERLVLVTKGAHPDGDRARVTPADITDDLRESTERLGGPVDLYLLHRDDPAVEVSTLVDALDAHRRAGEIGAFGVSNWTLPRIEEANAYAAATGVPGICCNSPHLSLAVQNELAVAGLLVGGRCRVAGLAHADRAPAARLVRAGRRLLRRLHRRVVARLPQRRQPRAPGACRAARPPQRRDRQRRRGRLGTRPAVPDDRGHRAAQRRAPAREPRGAGRGAQRRRGALAEPRGVDRLRQARNARREAHGG